MLFLTRVAVVAVGCVLPSGVFAQQKAPEPAADTVSARLAIVRKNLGDVLELRQLLSKEDTDWKLGRDILNDRIKFLRDQLAELAARKFDEEGKIGEADKEREKLVKDAEGLTAADDVVRQRVREFEMRIRRMLPALPPTLVAKISPLVERLPKPDLKEEDIRLAVAARYANVLGIANEINKFHSDIISSPEERQISDGRKAEVETLYVGLAQAFYVGSGEIAKEAGRGVATLEGWKWKAMGEKADTIAKVLKTYGGSGLAEFFEMQIETNDSTKTGGDQ